MYLDCFSSAFIVLITVPYVIVDVIFGFLSGSRFDNLPAIAVNDQRRIPYQATSKIPRLDVFGGVVMKNPAKVVLFSLVTQDPKFYVGIYVPR